MKINWKVRFKNPQFLFQILLSIVTPIFAYFGLTGTDMTSWEILGDTMLKAISNPYICLVVLISVWNTIQDPTVKGISDGMKSIKYEEPADNCMHCK